MILLQDLFDSQAEFGTKEIGLLNSMIDLQQEYDHETNNPMFSISYFKALKEIADEYELDYTEPRFRGGLKIMKTGVDSSPVLH